MSLPAACTLLAVVVLVRLMMVPDVDVSNRNDLISTRQGIALAVLKTRTVQAHSQPTEERTGYLNETLSHKPVIVENEV
jgi:hypothetical protein